MKKHKFSGPLGLFIIVLVAVGALVAACTLFVFYTDLIELAEIGAVYTSVFFKNLNVMLVCYAVSYLSIFMVFFVNNLIVRRVMLNRGSELPFLKRKTPFVLVSILITVLAGSLASTNIYSYFLPYLNSTPFYIDDPIFSRDVGYYVFQRPFLIYLYEYLCGISLFLLIYTTLTYCFLYAQKDMSDFAQIVKEDKIIIHTFFLILMYFLIQSCGYGLKSEGIVFSEFAKVNGAGFTAINVWLRYYRIAPFLLIGIVLAALHSIWKGKLKRCAITVAVFPACLLLVNIIAFFVQTVIVNPNEIGYEQPYIQHNLNMTKHAYRIDDDHINQKEYPVNNDLTLKDIRDNKNTIENIRVIGVNETLAATNSLQGLRNFYRFNDTDIVEYNINGKKTAVCLAPREFDKEKLPDSSKSYANVRFKYTHGYGVVMSHVNSVTEDGLPRFIIKDIPVESFEGAPQVTQPRIYFGELTNDYVIVNNQYKETDYMDGDKTVEYSYQGNAGIRMSWINKLLFAVKKADPMMLASANITSESRILTNRNVIERAKKAIPFLTYDKDPYIVIDHEGKIKWILDAYTTTEYYPYSQYYNGINYMRNSVKVIIDAFEGNVEFYVTDMDDPIIATYNKIYPGVFKTEPIPQDISQYMRYSETLFKLQAEVYKKYHISEAEAFFSKSDFWDISNEKYQPSSDAIGIDPHYNLMKIDPSSPEELVLMLPFVQEGKHNMVSWLAARGNGQMVAYQFPKGRTVYGTTQIENMINNEPNISKELALSNQGDSKVVRGNLLVIPIKNSLLYVSPVYVTTRDSAAIPVVKRVIVAYGDAVVMDFSVEKALEVLFGAKKPEFTDVDESFDDVLQRAIDQFNDMKNYSRELDWEMFGRKLMDLDKTFKDLEERKREVNQTTPTQLEHEEEF